MSGWREAFMFGSLYTCLSVHMRSNVTWSRAVGAACTGSNGLPRNLNLWCTCSWQVKVVMLHDDQGGNKHLVSPNLTAEVTRPIQFTYITGQVKAHCQANGLILSTWPCQFGLHFVLNSRNDSKNFQLHGNEFAPGIGVAGDHFVGRQSKKYIRQDSSKLWAIERY